jgi:indole-3-glycerol phosphate synthase
MPFLEEILDSTRARLAEARSKVTEEVLEQRIAALEQPRGFAASLQGPEMSLIAEIKRATPSRGELDLSLDASKLALSYAEGGAAAVSVLTEPDFFKGSLEDLEAARGCGLPVLRKDIVIDPWQVMEARAWGADAVLVIVRCVEDAGGLIAAIHALGMDALVEVYSEDDMERALDAGARLIGINHRDLDTFEVDDERTAKLAPMVPEDIPIVALSGVARRSDVEALRSAGATAILVGESLVTSADPAGKIRELLGTS